jgi:CelD/BcsL family acetyltransferase involved in cellulose biosynthesis
VSNTLEQPVAWIGVSRRAYRKARLAEALGLTVTKITSAEALDSLRADYDELNRDSALALPFTLLEWHRAWCTSFLAATEAIEDSLHVYVVRLATGRCVGIVPMVHTRRLIGPLNVRSLTLLGADRALTEIRTPLIAPGYDKVVARRVQQELRKIGRWDWIQWIGVTAAFGRGLAGPAELRWQPPIMDYILDLPADWETFRKSLKRNIRESLRHCYNSLKRDQRKFSLVVLDSPKDIQGGLVDFLRLHAMRAQMLGTVAHPDHFASATSQAFLREVCARLALRDITRVFQLIVDGQVVATRVGFVMGDTLYLYYSGFDPAFARYSVMTTVLAEIIKFAIAKGIRTVNLSPGTDVGKTRWGPREVPISQLVQVERSVRARVARKAYEFARSGKGWIGKITAGSRRPCS